MLESVEVVDDVLHTSDIEAIEALRDAGDQITMEEITEGPTEEDFHPSPVPAPSTPPSRKNGRSLP